MAHGYLSPNESEIVAVEAVCDRIGGGTLICSDSRLAFAGNNGQYVDIGLNQIDAIEYNSGEEFTAFAVAGWVMLAFGFALMIGGILMSLARLYQAIGVALIVQGIIIGFAGFALASKFTDDRRALRIHSGTQTWVFEGSQLKRIPDGVAEARDRASDHQA